MRTIILAGLALAAIAVPASAQSLWTAAPAQVMSDSVLVAENVAWTCDAAGCRSTSDTSDADPMTTCKALARQVGILTAFAASRPFAADRLQKCNESAPKTAKP